MKIVSIIFGSPDSSRYSRGKCHFCTGWGFNRGSMASSHPKVA